MILKKVIDICKTAVKLLLRIVCFFFFAFRINDKDIFVNDFNGASFGGNPKAIADEIHSMNKGFRFFVVTRDNRKSNPPYFFLKRYSFNYFFHLATSKIWISSVRMPASTLKRKEQVYIQTWHGAFGFKKVEEEISKALAPTYVIDAKHDSKLIDFYVSDNSDMTDLFLKRFWYKKGEILKIGSPRNDSLYRAVGLVSSGFKRKIGLYENKKYVLFAPTLRDDGNLSYLNIDYKMLIDTLAEKYKGQWEVLLKLHPKIANTGITPLSDSNIVKNVSNGFDVQDLLLAADVLITDYSSICFDFAILNRPAFLYVPDIAKYNLERGFHFSPYESPFLVAKTEEGLMRNIDDFKERDYLKELHEFRQKYDFYSKGNASEIIAKFVLQLMNE